MAGIETGGVTAQADKRINPFDNKEAKAGQADGKNTTPQKGDSVSLDNFIGKLIERLNNFFAGNKMAKDQFAQSITELSVRANVKQTFEGSVQAESGGSKVSAYYKQTTEVSVQVDMRMSQAQQVVDAQAAALDANPFSPEATAQRITDFALQFFPMYAKQHQNMSYEDQVKGYKELVGGAINQGFTEAMKILGDLPKEIGANISQTKDLVDQKLNSFFDFMLGKGSDKARKAAAEGGDWGAFVKDFFKSEAGENKQSEQGEQAEEPGQAQKTDV
ncbi:MAG: DUF5610 domain-containing protein [Nitrospinae bacterium]|nr:DUF5610 domain-containing protein [Nitrospinota bacterium]